MDTSMLDNHPALQAIRENETDDEIEQIQIFPEHEALDERLSKSLYYGRDTPSCDRFSLPITELCVDYFNVAGFDTSLTGQSDLDITKSRLDRLDVTRAAAVSRETCASPTSLVLALVYLERLRGSNPTYLHSVSSADLFLVSLLVASKLLHDDGEEDEVFNEEWAASAGMEKKDLNRLEIEFLSNIDWNCHVSPGQFDKMTDRLEKRVIQRQIDRRNGGWTTYSDIHVLSKHINLQIIWERLANLAFQVTAVCLAAYAASLMTMIGTCYTLTKANLGPSAVSDSLHTIKSAVTTPSSKELRMPSPQNVQHHRDTRNTSLVTEDDISALADIDPNSFEAHLTADNEDLATYNILNSIICKDSVTKQVEHPNNGYRFDPLLESLYPLSIDRHKSQSIILSNHKSLNYQKPENDSHIREITIHSGSNDTFMNDHDQNHVVLDKQETSSSDAVMIEDKNIKCHSEKSLPDSWTFSAIWKIDELFFDVISPPRNLNWARMSCSAEVCQNNPWKASLDDDSSMEFNQRNAFF